MWKGGSGKDKETVELVIRQLQRCECYSTAPLKTGDSPLVPTTIHNFIITYIQHPVVGRSVAP